MAEGFLRGGGQKPGFSRLRNVDFLTNFLCYNRAVEAIHLHSYPPLPSLTKGRRATAPAPEAGYAGIAQMEEYLICTQGAAGSKPATSSKEAHTLPRQAT